MVATKHNQSYVLKHTRLASLLSRVLKAHTSDFVSHSSDRRALFTLFQLQFGAMSPNRAIKLECVSSIVWDKASVEDVHYASLVDMKLKELSILHCADPQFCQEHKPVLNTSCHAICDCLIQSAKHCIPITSACKQVARWSAVDGLWFPLCWSHS